MSKSLYNRSTKTHCNCYFNKCHNITSWQEILYILVIVHVYLKDSQLGWVPQIGRFPQLCRIPQLGRKSSFSQMGRFFPQLVLKIIRHSHNWAEKYTSFPQMGRFYIDSRSDVWRYVSRMAPIANRKKKKKTSWDGRSVSHTRRCRESIPEARAHVVYVLKKQKRPLL